MFTSHNVLLPDGSQTAPGRVVVADSGACRVALRELESAFGPGPHPDVRVADLGCLEGGYAAEFARAGYDVTGVEARQENYDRAVQLQAALGLPNLRFIRGDVREVLPGMTFDAIFCCGLLYHLDRPVAFLKLLGQVTRKMLILNTHYSMEGGHSEHLHHRDENCEAIVTDGPEGRPGHWFHEGDNRWASYGSTDSFWLAKDALMLSIEEAGFGPPAEMHDWQAVAVESMPWGSGGGTRDRGMFVAFKP